ncbi:flippase [Mycolicibacterium sp. 3033]|nr:flippase [Mycolicibacterium aurantiacum]
MSSSFARNTVLGFASGAAVALAGFVGNAVVARLLGPERLGVFAYVVWCVTVAATVASIGIDVVQQRFLPNLRAEGRGDEADGLIGATTRAAMVAMVVVGIVLIGYLVGPGKGALAGTSPDVVIAVAAVWFVSWKLGDLYLFYLRGEQRFGEVAKLSAVSALLKVLMFALGAWLFGIPGALVGYIAGNLLPASRVFRLLGRKPRVTPTLRREVIRFALGSWAVGVIGSLVFGRTQVVFLEHYSTLTAVGLFAAAVTVAEMAVQLPPMLLSALLPRFSEQHGAGDQEHMLRLYRTTTALIAMVIVPLCLGLAAVASVLIPALFGAEYADAVPAAVVLLIAAAVSALGVTTLYLLYSTGKTAFLVISNGLGLVVTIALGFVLIPRYGLMGAAWSRAIAQVLVVLLETWYVTAKLGFRPPYRVLGALSAAAVTQAAVAYLISTQWGGPVSLAVAIPAAIVVYFVALRALSVTSMVDPGLMNRLVEKVPEHRRPLVRRALKLSNTQP